MAFGRTTAIDRRLRVTAGADLALCLEPPQQASGDDRPAPLFFKAIVMPRSHQSPLVVLAAIRARLRRFRSGGADRPDAALTELADELAANDRRLRGLLAGDGRDTEDIPGFDELADRQREIVEQLCRLPAREVDGLVAKARGIRLRDPAMGYDGAAVLGWSLAGDVVRLLGPSA